MDKRFWGMVSACVIGLAGLFGLSGCNKLGTITSFENPKTVNIIVNGTNVTQSCPVLYRNDTLYVSSVGILQELGAVTLERPGADAKGPYTLLAVTADHAILHVAGTDEALVDGKTVALNQPSVVEGDEVFVNAALFETILAAQVSAEAGDITIELAQPGEVRRLLDLNAQKQAAYFLPDRFFRYADYATKHIDLDVQKAVVYVNANLDKPFYTEIEPIADPEDLLVLCNKYNQLPRDYEPRDLQPMGDGYYLRAEAAAAYREMTKTAAQQNLSFQLKSAFRSYDTQAGLYNSSVSRNGKERADVASARPGHSEHQTGLALDVTQPTGDYGLSSANFETTPQYEWLSKHAHEFGFIQRYQADTMDITGFMYEPWHYRYVGTEAAAEIYEAGITFEEYVAMYKMD
ncbi:MAG: D-alanyl-D-alanine carboxypeptidase family protein [Peptococcaceae bacterium]|nr:D-alanyl-D-alanine carboxypeptidase family protein [Peptococcaceae bacterium]